MNSGRSYLITAVLITNGFKLTSFQKQYYPLLHCLPCLYICRIKSILSRTKISEGQKYTNRYLAPFLYISIIGQRTEIYQRSSLSPELTWICTFKNNIIKELRPSRLFNYLLRHFSTNKNKITMLLH